MGFKSRFSKRAELDGAAIERAQSDLTDRDDGSEAQKGAMIDNKSIADYKKQFDNHRLQNRHATDAEILHHVKEYIKKKIDGTVDEACRKRIMDLTAVTLSVLSSMAIPFSGVAVVVAATVMQCLNFSVTLGLIPLLNVRSVSDLTTMSSQIGNTIKRASKSGLMAGVEAAVFEILKNLGVGTWMWTEILRDILIEMVGNGASDAAWIMTPILAVPKYMMHRHLIKRMYRKLGDKAHVVHRTWTEQNCGTATVQSTVVYQAAVDEYGNVQGAYLQSQEVNGASAHQTVSQTNAYFQQPSGGQPQLVSQTNSAYFQPPNGQAQVPQTVNAYSQQQNGATPQAQVSQTSAHFHQPSNGQPQVSQTNAYFQQQAPQYPQSCQSPYAANQAAPGMVPGYYPQLPMQPNSRCNPSSFQPQATQIMGHTTPANSSYWQPQGGVYQASAAAQIHTPQPNPTYFQQPYGTQPIYRPQGQPQGNPYVQMGDNYNKAQVGSPQGNPYVQMGGNYNKVQVGTPGQSQGNPYVQMGDNYNKAQVGTPGQPQGNPYVQMGGNYNNAQVGTPGQPQFSPYGQALQMQAPMAYPQASAPPVDLRYQQQAN